MDGHILCRVSLQCIQQKYLISVGSSFPYGVSSGEMKTKTANVNTWPLKIIKPLQMYTVLLLMACQESSAFASITYFFFLLFIIQSTGWEVGNVLASKKD